MKNRIAISMFALGGLVLLAGLAAFGQTKGYTPPKNPWEDHPDFSGIWQAKASAGDDVEKLLVDPSNKKLPYLSDAMAKQKTNSKNRAKIDPVGYCYMPGIPRLMYINYPFQIFQTAKYIMVVSEFAHVYRQIFMDGSPHLEDVPGGQWLGDSRGKWDGESLNVDVIGFNDQTWFDKAGNYHSDQLHVQERFTRTAPDVLTYEATITDPKTYSKPWKMSVPLALHKEPNFRLMEYECQDLAPATE